MSFNRFEVALGKLEKRPDSGHTCTHAVGASEPLRRRRRFDGLLGAVKHSDPSHVTAVVPFDDSVTFFCFDGIGSSLRCCLEEDEN
jgi:hypothetical protein